MERTGIQKMGQKTEEGPEDRVPPGKDGQIINFLLNYVHRS
jgi:hypothetical protein